MPLFIFMCGAAVPYAMTKRLAPDGRPTAAFWTHLAARMALLWFLGLVLQGNFFAFDVMKFNPYSNTLQAIAAGYLVTSLAMLVKVRWFRPALMIGCLVVYGVALHVGGDYTLTGNFAYKVDQAIFSLMVPPHGNPLEGPWTEYTWWLSSLTFAAMSLAGALSREVLRSEATDRRKLCTLFAGGLAALAAGWALDFAGVPVIKKIMTVSFTLEATGWCVLSLAVLYYLIDVRRWVPAFRLVILFGQYALAAYLLGNLFRGVIYRATDIFVFGLPRLFGQTPQPFLRELVAIVILTWALWMWKLSRINGKAR